MTATLTVTQEAGARGCVVCDTTLKWWHAGALEVWRGIWVDSTRCGSVLIEAMEQDLLWVYVDPEGLMPADD